MVEFNISDGIASMMDLQIKTISKIPAKSFREIPQKSIKSNADSKKENMCEKFISKILPKKYS
jgi:hypothetical protein